MRKPRRFGQENPAFYGVTWNQQGFLAQICVDCAPCISRLMHIFAKFLNNFLDPGAEPLGQSFLHKTYVVYTICRLIYVKCTKLLLRTQSAVCLTKQHLFLAPPRLQRGHPVSKHWLLCPYLICRASNRKTFYDFYGFSNFYGLRIFFRNRKNRKNRKY